MPDRIIHKRSLTADSVPATSSLELGEIALNIADGRLYFRQSGSVGDITVSPIMPSQTSSMAVAYATSAGDASSLGSVGATDYARKSGDPIEFLNRVTFQESVDFNNTATFYGALVANDMQGTASWATNAVTSSYIDPLFISASAASYGFGSGGGATTPTGSLLTTASFTSPNITFTKGDSTTFAVNIASLTSSLVQASQTSSFVTNDQTSSFVTNSQTGSYLTTASVSLNTITFTKANGTTFPITVNTGSGGGSGAAFPFSGNAVITGSLFISGSGGLTITGSGILTAGAVGGDEGGEILLGRAITNTTLTGSGVTIDVYQNRLRIFEQGGSNRGGYFDITDLATGVGTNLSTAEVTLNRQAASYVLALTDIGKLVEMNVGTANTLTVPSSSTANFPIGAKIDIAQYGAGQTTVTTGSINVLLRSAGSANKLAAQYAGATVVKIGTDEWYLFGNITV